MSRKQTLINILEKQREHYNNRKNIDENEEMEESEESKIKKLGLVASDISTKARCV